MFILNCDNFFVDILLGSCRRLSLSCGVKIPSTFCANRFDFRRFVPFSQLNFDEVECISLFESVQIRGLHGVDFFKDVTVRFGSVL